MTQDTTGTPRTVLAVLIAVILVGSAVPIGAVVLSDPTGIIHGRAPTAVGDLYALMPGGTTVVTNNVIVSQTATPNQFTVSPVTTGITPYDADGDTGLTMTPDMSSATLVWKQSNGTPLTAAQLAAPLVSNFPNSTVTLEVHAPVTATSTTGLPTTAGAVPFVTAYTVKVPAAPVPMPASVRLSLNSYLFATSTGVPTIAFPGAYFDIYMNGSNTSTNANYTYAVDQAHVTVTTAGRVTINSKPTNAQSEVSVTATSKVTGIMYTYKFKTVTWYVKQSSAVYYAATSAEMCTGSAGATPTSAQLGGRVPTGGQSAYTWSGNVSIGRGKGYFFGEWGDTVTSAAPQFLPHQYGSGGQNLGYGGAWAKEITSFSSFGLKGRAALGPGWVTNGTLNKAEYGVMGYLFGTSTDATAIGYYGIPMTLLCVSSIGP